MLTAIVKKLAFREESTQMWNDILRRISFHADVFFASQVCDTWTFDTYGSGHVQFHLVCHGSSCWLYMPDSPEAIALHAGDVVVVPHGSPHVLCSAKTTQPAFGKIELVKQPMDKSAPGTAFICGNIIIDPIARKLLFNELPGYLVVNANTSQTSAGISRLLDLLFFEASNNAIGTTAMLDKIADALFFHLLRYAIEKDIVMPGIIGILGDPQLCKSVHAFSINPEQDWSLQKLASFAFVSRSVYAERFLKASGLSPMEFVTMWRMYMARRWLEEDQVSVANAALRCGYESPAAFSKAFKRVIGVGPGQIRKLPGD